MLEREGWRLLRTRGSHRQYGHPIKKGLVTVPGKPSAELAAGTLNYPWKKPSMAFFHLGNPENAEGFRGCRSLHPAAADCLHSLLTAS